MSIEPADDLPVDDGWRAEELDAGIEAGEEWPSDDLEAAYLKALEASEAVEWDLAQADSAHAGEDGDATADQDGAPSASSDSSATASSAQNAPTDAAAMPESRDAPPEAASRPERVSARQVIEAALFVGGQPLTTRKLCQMLRGDYDFDAIEQAIDELNELYEAQQRPYEIRLGEGGYRMVLHADYERLRHRVYGIGPREVKLSQDVLEVLALVAYRQPITQSQMEELGKSNPGAALRQLLRRELISLERDTENRKQVTYRTTRRFLSLFGLARLEDLPQVSEFAFK